jgi:poly-beta-1,6-N-acetyl-D-glucosamine synthase
MILLAFTITFFIGYSVLIIYYWVSWKSIPEYIPSSANPDTRITVIIPARNEAESIGLLLRSLADQTYPADRFEIIVVNDHSTDATVSIVQSFPSVKLMNLEGAEVNAQKKKAIEAGISHASGDLIVTTDADCIVPTHWLQLIAACRESTGAVFIAAPVVFNQLSSKKGIGFQFLSVFQQLDFMILQGITGASVYRNFHAMCNGANLAYDKNVFFEVDGFKGIDHIASGDDMMLMHKIIQRYPGKVEYLKSRAAIVQTKPMQTWKQFFNQRIRWASKAVYYEDKRIIAVLWMVYLLNLSFLVLILIACLQSHFWIWVGGFWLLKTLVELPFCISVASFFNRQRLSWYLFFLQPVHIFYTIISGLLGQVGTYEWKGRKVN